MNFKILFRGIAYLALAVALLATAIALNNRQYPPAETSKIESSPPPGTLDAELACCKAIGTEAADDASCKAVWQANRERFLESKKLYQDRVTDFSPAASNPNEPVAAPGGELPGRALHWLGESAGQPQ